MLLQRVLFMLLVVLAMDPTRAQASAGAQQDPESAARAFVEEMAAGRFEQATARFDETVAKLMSAPKLAETWQMVSAQAGAFQEITGVSRADARGYLIVIVTCQFEAAAVNVRVSFGTSGRIAGLWFTPAQPKASWSPAGLVKPDAFEERSVTIGNDRWVLPGTLSVPKGKGPFPAVVLVHGSGPHDEDETIGPNKPFKDLAWGLATRGVAVLRYVKRTKKYPQEVATLLNLTVREEVVEDAERAVDVLASQPEISSKQVYVLGHSLGAMLAPRIAAGAKSVAGIVLLAGSMRPMEELVLEQVKYLANLDGKITTSEQKQIEAAEQFAREVRSPALNPTQQVKMLGATIPGSYLLDLRNYHAGEAAAGLSIPILVLQGERDYQVRTTDFESWKKVLRNRPHATLKSYAVLNHLFMAGSGPGAPAEYDQPGHVAEEVIQDIADWIQARGKKSPGPQPKK